jgi:hypothetical protein
VRCADTLGDVAGRKPKRRAEWLARDEARLRAIGVLVASRTTIGDDKVVGRLVSELLRKHRDVRWITTRAAALDGASPTDTRQVDHVVPVHVLVERILNGDDPAGVLAASGQCYVTKSEHNDPKGLAKFRQRHSDLGEQMLKCELSELLDYGWERYRRSGISWATLNP